LIQFDSTRLQACIGARRARTSTRHGLTPHQNRASTKWPGVLSTSTASTAYSWTIRHTVSMAIRHCPRTLPTTEVSNYTLSAHSCRHRGRTSCRSRTAGIVGRRAADAGWLWYACKWWRPFLYICAGDISTMTPEQLYFMSAANTWCSNFPPDVLINLIQTDVHSPDQFRVIG
jgi:hypothetical protein